MIQLINKTYPQVNFRYLNSDDSQKGLWELLNQLTKAPEVSKQKFQQHLNKMAVSNSNHVNILGVDKQSGKIVAFGSIIVCETVLGRMGKIENIVTCKSMRGKGYGKIIIDILKNEGQKDQCQKISLYCQGKNVEFYQKLGFKQEGKMCSAYQ